GPLTNPAGARLQLVGVFDRHWQKMVAEVLARLDTERAFVVNAADGLDEISNGSLTTVAEVRDGKITWFKIDPREHGMEMQQTSTIVARDALHSLSIITEVFDDQPGPARDIVALNGGAAIYLCGIEDTLADGVVRAKSLLADGSVRARFERFIEFTKQQTNTHERK
ncbi:MAG: anthranilate phosphoribosyltransferase, partial [Gammaproteobacteria bacterium]